MRYLSRPVWLLGTSLFLAFLVFDNPANAQQQPPLSTDAQATVVTATSTVADVPTTSPPSGAPGSVAPQSTSLVPAVASTQSPPEGLAPIMVGPLELIPSSANLLLKYERDYRKTYFKYTLRFKIRNNSASEVKIISFQKSIVGSDDYGQSTFLRDNIRSGGIMLSDQWPNNFNKAFTDEISKFVTLSPKQIFEVQLTNSLDTDLILDDGDTTIYNSHRPKKVSFSGTLGIITIDGTKDLRGFSFSDVPLNVVAPKI